MRSAFSPGVAYSGGLCWFAPPWRHWRRRGAGPRRDQEVSEIIAPAGPGGGYDQLAGRRRRCCRSRESRLRRPGAEHSGCRRHDRARPVRHQRTRARPTVLVAGLGMVGAILTNKSPVTLDQVAPLARLTGEYQPLVVAADSPIKSLATCSPSSRPTPARSAGAASLWAVPTTS